MNANKMANQIAPTIRLAVNTIVTYSRSANGYRREACRYASENGQPQGASGRKRGSLTMQTPRATATSPRSSAKKAAETFQATVKVDVGKGVHTAPSKSITVAEGCRLWLETGAAHGL